MPRRRRSPSLGGGVLVLAASTGGEGYEDAGDLTPPDGARSAQGIDRVMVSAGDRGLRVAVHPHHGTVVERPEDVERLLDVSAVRLCLDTGHLMVGGGDPVALARTAGSRIVHVHLKDVDAAIAERVAAGDLGYHAGVRAGLYRPLGDGDVDVRGVLRAVEESAEVVWYVLEQDEVLDHEPEPGVWPAPVREAKPRVPGAGVGGGGRFNGEVVPDDRASWPGEKGVGSMVKRLAMLAFVFALVATACTGDDDGDGDGDGNGDGGVTQRDFRFVVVTHGQASDPFWSVAANGVDAAAEDMGVEVDTRRPAPSTWWRCRS